MRVVSELSGLKDGHLSEEELMSMTREAGKAVTSRRSVEKGWALVVTEGLSPLGD